MSSIEQLTVLLNEAAESLPAQRPINDEKRNAFTLLMKISGK